jgi:hypothetical protein
MTAFRQILTLANSYGWEPMGTENGLPETDSEWDGSYLSNNFQIILKEDAVNLAKALELALPDLPIDPQAERNIDSYLEDHLGLPYTDQEPLVFFAGRQELIQDFIAFCKECNNITIA